MAVARADTLIAGSLGPPDFQRLFDGAERGLVRAGHRTGSRLLSAWRCVVAQRMIFDPARRAAGTFRARSVDLIQFARLQLLR